MTKQTARRGGRGRRGGPRPSTRGARVEFTGIVIASDSTSEPTAASSTLHEELPRLVIVSPPTSPEISPSNSDSERDSGRLPFGFEDNIRNRLPPLHPPTGPPIIIRHRIGGCMTDDPDKDPRLVAVSRGFPVSVRPLRLPNTRAMWVTGSSTSVIDYRFVRLAGLLHEVIPLRKDVDDVKLMAVFGGSLLEVFGRVNVLLDAQGYELEVECWVVNIGFPVELLLGMDVWKKYNISTSISEPGGVMTIVRADARRVRDIDDVYQIR